MGGSLSKRKCKYTDCNKRVSRDNLCICHKCLHKESVDNIYGNPVKKDEQFCSYHISECQYTKCETVLTEGNLCTLHQCIHTEDDVRCTNAVIEDRQFCENHCEDTRIMRLLRRLYFFTAFIRPLIL
jgi:predicted nucleic acid-binding Zn ribbon protein